MVASKGQMNHTPDMTNRRYVLDRSKFSPRARATNELEMVDVGGIHAWSDEVDPSIPKY
jgi:hypothetical protein